MMLTEITHDVLTKGVLSELGFQYGMGGIICGHWISCQAVESEKHSAFGVRTV